MIMYMYVKVSVTDYDIKSMQMLLNRHRYIHAISLAL